MQFYRNMKDKYILALHDKNMKTFKERLAAHYKNIIFLQVVFGTQFLKDFILNLDK